MRNVWSGCKGKLSFVPLGGKLNCKALAEKSILDHIELTPGTRGGKPRIADTRITVADVVLMHRRMGRGLEEIAGTYDLSLAAVYAAMAYYYDHKDEIDQSLDQDEEFAEALRQNSSSRLRERLKMLSRG